MDTNTQVEPVDASGGQGQETDLQEVVGDRAGRRLRDRRHLPGDGQWRRRQPVADTPAASAPVEEKSEPKAKEPVAEAPEATQAPAPKPKPAPAPAKPTMTKAQEQAMGAAEDYLNSSHFSKSGLIDQLEYEGYSAKDAKFAVTHIKVSWNEQAAGAAEVSQHSHFSRSGLIEQLKYEGYTQTQAVYGVNKAGL